MRALETHPRNPGPIVLVSGSRIWDDRESVYRDLDDINPLMVVTAGGNGASAIAGDWCNETGTTLIVLPKPWKKHGDQAGELNNTRILEHAEQLAFLYHTTLRIYLYLWGPSPTTRHMLHIANQHRHHITTLEKPAKQPNHTN